MKVLIAGGSGFIGKAVIAKLLNHGHEVSILTRNPEKAREGLKRVLGPEVNEMGFYKMGTPLEGFDGVINLAGENIAIRWTPENKRKIVDSRVKGTRELLKAVSGTSVKAFINASAVGFYGDRGDEILTEKSVAGNGFLAQVCRQWEDELTRAPMSIRTVSIRIGLVLGPSGGALEKMIPLFQAGLGGRLGLGQQWMSWIHINDLASLFTFALENESLSGAYNAVAPEPVTNSQFTKELGSVLKRPTFFRVPERVLKVFLGEAAGLLLSSQRVSSERVQKAGFQFQYRTVAEALKSLLE